MVTKDAKSYLLNEFITNDVISSFLYASAINVVLAQGVLKIDLTIFVSLGAIVFLFVDWLSRVTIPISFPENDQARRRETWVKLTKAGLEIILVFAVVTTCMHYLNPQTSNDAIINSNVWFAIFLFTSFLWNLLMLYVMKQIDFLDLAFAVYLGDSYDIEKAKPYTERLNLSIKNAEDKFAKSFDFRSAKQNFKRLKRGYILQGLIRTIGQLVVNHLTWINLFVACILLFNLEVDQNVLGQFIIYGQTFYYSYIVVILLLIIPIYIYYKICYVTKRKDKVTSKALPVNVKLTRSLAAISIFLFFIFYYLILNHTILIVAILIQQTIVGLFLRYAIPDKVQIINPSSSNNLGKSPQDMAPDENGNS